VVKRGPLRSGIISQFLSDVVWDKLDVLISDLPPGTGDEVLTASQKMLPQIAIIVTTPQEVSLLDCRRAVNMAKKLNIKHIGIVENMSGFICPKCGEELDFFGTGGGKKMAEEMKVHYLGHIPMEKENRECGDNVIERLKVLIANIYSSVNVVLETKVLSVFNVTLNP
jgi:ATP-binding protein involved in chromosome partitioning